jgi:hypothetical protein
MVSSVAPEATNMTLDRLDTLIAFAVVMLGVSLLITIATQMISSFLGLRGSNLLWGIKVVLKDCGVTTELDKIALAVLTDTKSSDSLFSEMTGLIGRVVRRWRLATAIRPDELARALKRIATSPDQFGGTPTAEAINNVVSEVDSVAQDKLRSLSAALFPANVQWTVAADKMVQEVSDSARQSVLKLETSFASAMDRVAQRFAMKMRMFTVLFALVVAFGAHLDSLQLLQRLATNTEQRTALVSMSNTMLKQAQSAGAAGLSTGGTTPAPVVAPPILKEAMDSLKKNATDSHLPATPDFASYTEAALWLRANGQSALEARYQQAVFSTLQQHATDITNQLNQGGFRLLPSPYQLLPLVSNLRNLLGILITAAFLSLGAPFWFNALKGLSSLRTAVADNEKKETGKA